MCINIGDIIGKLFCLVFMICFTLWVGYILVALPCYECRGEIETSACWKFNTTYSAAVRTCFRKSCITECSKQDTKWFITRTCMSLDDTFYCRSEAEKSKKNDRPLGRAQCAVCDSVLCNSQPTPCPAKKRTPQQ